MSRNSKEYSDAFDKPKHSLMSRMCWSLLLTMIIWLKSLWFVFSCNESRWFVSSSEPRVYLHPYGELYEIIEHWSEGAAWPHGCFLVLNLVAITIAVFELCMKNFSRKVKIGSIISIILNLIHYAIIFIYIYFWAKLVFHS